LYNVSLLQQHYGITREEMSLILNISVEALQKMEQGELPCELSATALLTIYDVFGIRPTLQFERLTAEDLRPLPPEDRRPG